MKFNVVGFRDRFKAGNWCKSQAPSFSFVRRCAPTMGHLHLPFAGNGFHLELLQLLTFIAVKHKHISPAALCVCCRCNAGKVKTSCYFIVGVFSRFCTAGFEWQMGPRRATVMSMWVCGSGW